MVSMPKIWSLSIRYIFKKNDSSPSFDWINYILLNIYTWQREIEVFENIEKITKDLTMSGSLCEKAKILVRTVRQAKKSYGYTLLELTIVACHLYSLWAFIFYVQYRIDYANLDIHLFTAKKETQEPLMKLVLFFIRQINYSNNIKFVWTPCLEDSVGLGKKEIFCKL